MKFKDLTQKIIGCAYRVHNKMGFGFLESIYHNCLLCELQDEGLRVESQKAIPVFYYDALVGEFQADIIVEDEVILELKSVNKIVEVHEVQLVNYLVATGKEIGLLINFGKSGVEVKRKYRDPASDSEISC